MSLIFSANLRVFFARSTGAGPLGLFVFCIATLALKGPLAFAASSDVLEVDVHYIEQQIQSRPTLSSLLTLPLDNGLSGAQLGIKDNQTTGQFLKHAYKLDVSIFQSATQTIDFAKNLLAEKTRLVILNVPETTLLKIVDLPQAQDDLFFNAREKSGLLRSTECRANLLHTMASRAMHSDALMQFLAYRKWSSIFLLEGVREGDAEFSMAMQQSAKKFGLKIREKKQWLIDADIRRAAAREVPLLTQARKYDVVVVVDESQDFSQFVLYNTWLPRPIAGSAGLTPAIWTAVMEQWGALQLQTRFEELSQRKMTELDYSNWAAARSIGEAVTRTNSTEIDTLRSYLLSPEFALAGFKGRKMSFRNWNGQLRQPISLAHAKGIVAMAPIEGFLHRVTELDTLGLDNSESKCAQF